MTDDTRKTDDPRTTGPNKMPAAGPHAKPELTDKEKTPGAGMLPDPDGPAQGGKDVDPGAG